MGQKVSPMNGTIVHSKRAVKPLTTNASIPIHPLLTTNDRNLAITGMKREGICFRILDIKEYAETI